MCEERYYFHVVEARESLLSEMIVGRLVVQNVEEHNYSEILDWLLEINEESLVCLLEFHEWVNGILTREATNDICLFSIDERQLTWKRWSKTMCKSLNIACHFFRCDCLVFITVVFRRCFFDDFFLWRRRHHDRCLLHRCIFDISQR